jgi:hypothetical protein
MDPVDILRVPTALKIPSSWALPEIVASPLAMSFFPPGSFLSSFAETRHRAVAPTYFSLLKLFVGLLLLFLS